MQIMFPPDNESVQPELLQVRPSTKHQRAEDGSEIILAVVREVRRINMSKCRGCNAAYEVRADKVIHAELCYGCVYRWNEKGEAA